MPSQYDKFIQILDTRLDSLSERVARIEGQQSDAQRSSPRKLVADYGGIVALLFSILTGGFTIYDKFVLEPLKRSVQDELELRNDLNQLSNIEANIAGLNWSNPQAATAQANSWTAQRLALLDKIKMSDKSTPGVLKFADRLMLANEYENYGRLNEALDEIAFAHKDAIDFMQRANAYWAEARLNGKLKNLARMRELFLKGIDEFKSGGMNNSAGSVMQLYIQWVAIELTTGDCSNARETYQRMTIDKASPDVWPSTRIETEKQFNFMLKQSPRSCDLAAMPETK